MARCVFAIPGDLDTPTGGYTYARKVIPFLAERFELQICKLPHTFPFPSSLDLEVTAKALAAADRSGAVFLIDGLAFGTFPAALIETLRSPIAVLLHHPLGLEEGPSASQKNALLKSEETALKYAAHIVVSSAATAKDVSRLFSMDPSRITVAEPGVMRGTRSSAPEPGAPLHIVSVGTVVPRKGYNVLLDAFDLIRDLNWRATIAGALDRSEDAVQTLKAKIAQYGLSQRVTLAGALNERSISALYTSGDIFALASLYEGYGMAFAEAMAHGLPVVASGDGAVKDTVPAEAGIYCETGNARTFADALRTLIVDGEIRRAKADEAWRHAATLPSWDNTAAEIASVLNRLVAA